MPDKPTIADIAKNERARIARNKRVGRRLLEIIAGPGRWIDENIVNKKSAAVGKRPKRTFMSNYMGGM